jgi:hypothetical protein
MPEARRSARGAGLTLLAPEIVEAILDGRQAATLKLRQLVKEFPAEWARQWAFFAVVLVSAPKSG